MTGDGAPGDKRPVALAVSRGLRGRCPLCGQGRILSGYMRPAPECSACGEDFAPFRTADFASYFVMFIIGLVFTPVIFVMSMKGQPGFWPSAIVCLLAVTSALALLPRAKGAGMALLWALDLRSNQ